MTKKELGQHWLRDEVALERIVAVADVSAGDTILEIGPGQGALTEKLAATGASIVALEFDQDLVPKLKRTFHSYDNVTITEGDIRAFDYSSLPKDYKVVANIPYYLTSNLIRALSETDNQPERAVLLVQREVAERICARPSISPSDQPTAHQPASTASSSQSRSTSYAPSKENTVATRLEHAQTDQKDSLKAKPGQMSVLSVVAQLYFACQLDLVVPAELFTPPPKVDSQVVILKRHEAKLFDVDYPKLIVLVKASFSNKRKTLANSLQGLYGLDKSQHTNILEEAGVGATTRAQQLSLKSWVSLYKTYKNHLDSV